jgi:hypothetical protein
MNLNQVAMLQLLSGHEPEDSMDDGAVRQVSLLSMQEPSSSGGTPNAESTSGSKPTTAVLPSIQSNA